MNDLRIPKLNSNDDSYVLLEWLVEAGAPVAAGDCVALVETSKAVADLEVTEDGFLDSTVPAGTRCRPGEVVARIVSDPAGAAPRAAQEPQDAGESEDADGDGPTITRAARALMAEHGISVADVAALGRRVVKEAEIAALVEAGTRPRREMLSPHQRAVAAAVGRSHATIPAAFTVIKVSAEPLQRRLQRLGEQARAFIGLPELVIVSLAGLHATFPRFFATVADDLSVEASETADIGITIDVGSGLYVPVIRDAAALTPREVSARLLDFRLRAVRRSFRETDLAAPRLTLSLHTDHGILLAQPIIFPGQVCTLSLCAPFTEVRLGSDGGAQAHEVFHVGIAYDHRVVNGRDAAAFLGALREVLETDDD